MHRSNLLLASLVGLALSALVPASARAQSNSRVGAGGHFGVNLDEGHPMLGADVLIDLADLSSLVLLSIRPSYTHVFIEDWTDVNLLSVDVPFQFRLRNPVARPYAAPGLGLSFSGGTTLKLNLIGGCIFHVNDRFEPFTELAVRFIDGTYVDLLAGMLIRF